MEHKRINWCSLPAQFISENSEILPDIPFKFPDGEVAAHKMVLGMVSKVFRDMFFVHNTMDKSAKEIVMEGGTRPAFKIMIDAMYNAKSVEESLQGSSVHEMFAALYWVTKYELPHLVLAVKDALSFLPITEDTALEVAQDAMVYFATFEEDAQNVLVACAKILRAKLSNYHSLLEFVAENGDKFMTMHKLVVLMNEMTPTPCKNCNSDPCLHGIGVGRSQCREGLKVACNPAAKNVVFKPEIKYLTGEVIEVVEGDNYEVKVKFNYALQDSIEKSDLSKVAISKKGELSFVFRCK